jgi:hypothetical protein
MREILPDVVSGVVRARADAGYLTSMTTTPNEPVEDPQVVPSGDPDIQPATQPGEDPGTPDVPNPDPTPPDLV